MEYGVKNLGEFVFCANCGRLISQNGEYDANFCFVCGAPLKMEAIERKEQEIKEIEDAYLKRTERK